MGVKIPQQSIVYGIIGILCILIFILLAIMPSQRALADLDEKITETKLKLEEQKILVPVYQQLKQRMEKKDPHLLPLPVNIPLGKDQMGTLYAAVKEICGRANVELISLAPILTSLAENSKSITMDAVVRGDFFSVRKYLIGLGSIPYVGHIDEIQIQRTANLLDIKVKFQAARN